MFKALQYHIHIIYKPQIRISRSSWFWKFGFLIFVGLIVISDDMIEEISQVHARCCISVIFFFCLSSFVTGKAWFLSALMESERRRRLRRAEFLTWFPSWRMIVVSFFLFVGYGFSSLVGWVRVHRILYSSSKILKYAIVISVLLFWLDFYVMVLLHGMGRMSSGSLGALWPGFLAVSCSLRFHLHAWSFRCVIC